MSRPSLTISSGEFFTDDIDGKSLIARAGGASDFDFVVMEMVGLIENDKELSVLFKALGKKGTASLERKFLTLIFGSNDEDSNLDDEDNKKQKVILLHYSLFQDGMSEKHFDRLVILLQQSLETAWVDAKLIEEFVSTMKKYRPLFELKQRQGLNLASYEEVADMVKKKSKRRSSAKKAGADDATKHMEDLETADPSGEMTVEDGTQSTQKRASWLLGGRRSSNS